MHNEHWLTHTYQPTNINLFAMIIDFAIVLLETYYYTK